MLPAPRLTAFEEEILKTFRSCRAVKLRTGLSGLSMETFNGLPIIDTRTGLQVGTVKDAHIEESEGRHVLCALFDSAGIIDS
jgi:hypothetical protein